MPGGAGSTRRRRCCPFPARDKHRQDLCFSSALTLCHPARQELVCAGYWGHRCAAALIHSVTVLGTSWASLPPRPCLTLRAVSHRSNKGQKQGVPSRRGRRAPVSLESSTPVTPARRAEPWDVRARLTPTMAVFRLRACRGLLLKWVRLALKWLGRSPGHCRSPSPAQSQGGCAAGTGRERGPAPQPALPAPRLGGQPKGQQPASPTEPESHAQHEKGEEKVTITTSATTSPRGNDHLTATLHTTGGRVSRV